MLKIRRKRLMNTKKHSIYLIALFFVSIFIGIGYSYLSSTLSVQGWSTVYKQSWDIHFENLAVTDGSISSGTSSIVTNSTQVNYTVPLASGGEYYEFTVDVVNSGSLDAMVGSIVNNGITTAQQQYLEYSATYFSGKEIKEGDVLKANSSEKILVRVAFKENVSGSILSSVNQTLNLSFNLTYIEANNSREVVHPICRRAKKLHTEPCAQINNNYHCMGDGYSLGQDITYGRLGTAGTLKSGDAFDCDVNGDGKYAADQERFYYVTDLEGNSDYKVLIYFNSVAEGDAYNEWHVKYDGNNNPSVNGPQAIKYNLPTTSQWKNVRLTNTTRKLKDELGNEFINISYSGFAARLLTTQELESGCNASISSLYGEDNPSSIGILYRNCNYILENGMYSKVEGYNGNRTVIAFENIYSADHTKVFYVSGWGRVLYAGSANGNYGSRPVIEVHKDRISY